MEFTRLEFKAICKLAIGMAAADGNVDDKELDVITLELVRFGVKAEEARSMFADARSMSASDAVILISKFDYSQKRYVAALLGVIMAIDRHIDDSEYKLWKLTVNLCGLPELSIAECASIMSDKLSISFGV